MKGQTTIKKDGKVITEVTDREGQDCKDVVKLTESVGKTIGEETTGPDNDQVHETTNG
jgi:hypothetical protein